MRTRRSGHIVLVSSLAALSPLPDAPGYSASKAGLLVYGQAMRAAVALDNVRVTVVCPGYVTSAMTDTHIGDHDPNILRAHPQHLRERLPRIGPVSHGCFLKKRAGRRPPVCDW
jgi:short-subunit dehydrogenase